jgi:hypothetical protein
VLERGAGEQSTENGTLEVECRERGSRKQSVRERS